MRTQWTQIKFVDDFDLSYICSFCLLYFGQGSSYICLSFLRFSPLLFTSISSACVYLGAVFSIFKCRVIVLCHFLYPFPLSLLCLRFALSFNWLLFLIITNVIIGVLAYNFRIYFLKVGSLCVFISLLIVLGIIYLWLFYPLSHSLAYNTSFFLLFYWLL